MDARPLLLTTASVLGASGCCFDDCCELRELTELETLELGTTAELHAIAPISNFTDDRSYSHVAVGSRGTVVA